MNTLVTPLRWDALPHYERETVRLLNMAAVGLPHWPYPGAEACAAIGEILGESLGGRSAQALPMEPLPVEATTFGRFVSGAPSGVLAALLFGKERARGLAWIESPLAFRAVDRLLGGPGHAPPELPEPTGVETGLLAYLILRVLRGIHEMGGAEADAVIRLARVLGGGITPEQYVTPGESCVVIGARVALSGFSGDVRVAVPDRTLRSIATGRPSAEPSGALTGARLTFRADVGYTELTPGDLSALEPGDVIVPELLTVAAREDGVVGGCILRPSTGGRGGIRAGLVSDGARLRAEVRDFVVDGLPERGSTEETSMDENDQVPEVPEEVLPDMEPEAEEAPPPVEPAPLPEGTTGEVSAMVGEVPLNVAIEMGRVKMSISEVSALTAGQILELRRPVGAPVELVVGGRVVAHGELIEIQGELGVRIGGIAR